MTNAEFLAHLNKIIGQTMRRLQLTQGPLRAYLQRVMKWLNMARQSLKRGWRKVAESDFRFALMWLRHGRRMTSKSA
jgi:hypothetical protein